MITQLPWKLDLKEFRGKVSFCMEWAYTRLIKGVVLEEKQRCVMNNIVEGWYLLLFNNMGLQLMTFELIAIISIIISILPYRTSTHR